MRIEFKETTSAGNNVRTIMFFDNIRVAELHCTPEEFDVFTDLVETGVREINARSGGGLHDLVVHNGK